MFVYSLGVSAPSSINATSNDTPSSHLLEQNYPNPFNPSTVIKYNLNNHENVRLIIYNSAGQSIRELINSAQDAGEHMVSWDGKNNAGMLLSSGVYYYQLCTDKYTQSKKMILLKWHTSGITSRSS